MPLRGCATELHKMECCFLEGDLCTNCWPAFDNDDVDLAEAVDFGNWLSLFVLFLIGMYNLYWYYQERKVYYAVRGATYQPYFGFAETNPRPTQYDKNEIANKNVFYGNTKKIREKRAKAAKRQSKLDALAGTGGGGDTELARRDIDFQNQSIVGGGIVDDDALNAGLAAEAASSIINPASFHTMQSRGGGGQEDDDNKDGTSINDNDGGNENKKEDNISGLNIIGRPGSDDDDDSSDDSDESGTVIAVHGVQHHTDPNGKDQILICYPYFRLMHVAYPITTGIFACFRSEFQLGKPLLVGAALHNLFEWGMVTYAYFDTPQSRFKAWIIQMCWIWFVIVMVVMIPTWPIFASAEQATGIMLDFLLPFTWSQLALQNWDNMEIRNMFIIAWLAHFTHLYGSIVPLMVESFSQGQSYVFSAIWEFLIFMTAVLAHVLYTAMISMYQSHVLSLNYYPPQYVAPKLGLWMPIAFFLGLFVTVIIPGLVGECED